MTFQLKTATGVETKTVSVKALIATFYTNKVSREHYLANKEMWTISPSMAFLKMLQDQATPPQNRGAEG